MITIICYDTIERWKSKKRAMDFYRKCAMYCDGCEAERYANIVWDIMDGKSICHDGWSTPRFKHKFPNGTDIRDLNGKVEYPLDELIKC